MNSTTTAELNLVASGGWQRQLQRSQPWIALLHRCYRQAS